MIEFDMFEQKKDENPNSNNVISLHEVKPVPERSVIYSSRIYNSKGSKSEAAGIGWQAVKSSGMLRRRAQFERERRQEKLRTKNKTTPFNKISILDALTISVQLQSSEEISTQIRVLQKELDARKAVMSKRYRFDTRNGNDTCDSGTPTTAGTSVPVEKTTDDFGSKKKNKRRVLKCRYEGCLFETIHNTNRRRHEECPKLHHGKIKRVLQ